MRQEKQFVQKFESNRCMLPEVFRNKLMLAVTKKTFCNQKTIQRRDSSETDAESLGG